MIARFDTIRLAQDGPDRVRISGTRGGPPPENLKVALNYLGGYRNTMTMVLTGLDIEDKASRAQEMLFGLLGGKDRFGQVDVRLIRSDRPDAPTNEQATAQLRITVFDPDPAKVGRSFSNATIELALAGYPGFFTTTPPTAESAYGVYWPAFVPAGVVEHAVVLPDGRRQVIPPAGAGPGEGAAGTAGKKTGTGPGEAAVAGPGEAAVAEATGKETGEGAGTVAEARGKESRAGPERADGFGGGGSPAVPGVPPARAPAAGPTRRAPLGLICGARSGDKGQNANVGLWARDPEAYDWLRAYLDVARFVELLPEAAGLEVRRYELPNLYALNFVVAGLLGLGVAASARPDPQAKGLGEYLRSRHVDIPVALLPP